MLGSPSPSLAIASYFSTIAAAFSSISQFS
jgi:hypothetical protein